MPVQPSAAPEYEAAAHQLSDDFFFEGALFAASDVSGSKERGLYGRRPSAQRATLNAMKFIERSRHSVSTQEQLARQSRREQKAIVNIETHFIILFHF
jgi:hypothetical protein